MQEQKAQKRELYLNPKFAPLWDNRDKYLILYGSRASSKSDFVAKMLVSRMLTHKYFRGIAIRKFAVDLFDSCFQTLVKAIDDMELTPYFKCTVSPMRIQCLTNDNQMIFRGMDEPTKIKSIKDPTLVWFEEEVPDTYEDYNTISLSIRTAKADFLQEVYTCNPAIPNYEEHWFWIKYFKDEPEKAFRKAFSYTNDAGRTFTQYATVHQSTYKDNTFLPADIAVQFELLKDSDPYLYARDCLGIWTNKIPKGQYYKKFTVAQNTVERKQYDPDKILHVSFDFNAVPYLSITVWQLYGRELYQIDEIAAVHPNNNTQSACKLLANRYRGHQNGMNVYGDATGRARSTLAEAGVNNYTIIAGALREFRAQERVPSANPNVKARGDFINEVFAGTIPGVHVWLNRDCNKTLNDVQVTKEDPSGEGKLKEKVRDKELGTYEKTAHLSDSMDYVICEIFKTEFNKFKSGGNTSKFVLGGRAKKKNLY